MRAYLRFCRKQMGLSVKTEIFPKQDKISDEDYGNGITIPYREFGINKDKSPKALVVYKDQVVPITPEQFCINVRNGVLSKGHFINYEPNDTREAEDTLEQEFDEGSMADPNMQKLSARDIY